MYVKALVLARKRGLDARPLELCGNDQSVVGLKWGKFFVGQARAISSKRESSKMKIEERQIRKYTF